MTDKTTSVLWYTYKEFEKTSSEYVRARPEMQLKEFVSLFRGFTSHRTIREVTQEVSEKVHGGGSGGNLDSSVTGQMQFFPTSRLSEFSGLALRELFHSMRARAKPISKRSIASVLGCVGEEDFESQRERNGWKRVRYVMEKGTKVECQAPHHSRGWRCESDGHVEYPFLVEIAVFDRQAVGDTDDGKGLKVYQSVNSNASREDIFSRIFDVNYRLGAVGILEHSPVTVVVNLVCPVLRWLDYGKSGLGEGDEEGGRGDNLSSVMEKAFNRILPVPRTPRWYRPAPPPKPVSWIPSGRLGDLEYERMLGEFAAEMKRINDRRSEKIRPSGRGWGYILEGLGLCDKGQFDAVAKAINDCRKIRTLPIIDFVAEDQDETRHFHGLMRAADPAKALLDLRRQVKEMLAALASLTTDYREGEEYYVMMVVEKGDILHLFRPVCEEYKVPIVSSKGWYPITLRAQIAILSKKAEERGLTPVVLLFYDHDPGGLKISDRFRKNLQDCERGTGWSPDRLVIDRFGLNADAIEKHNLTWIDNLKSSSGREVDDPEYIEKFGRRKCEANALFRNDETLRAGREMCRQAIERYLGRDALQRIAKKEETTRTGKLASVYRSDVWKSFDQEMLRMAGALNAEKSKDGTEDIGEPTVAAGGPLEVPVDHSRLASCPACGAEFRCDYPRDVGRTVRCRSCHASMKLVG
jgi:hypothetical protein